MDRLATIRLEGNTMIDAGRAAGLDAPVPTCEGWDVRRLFQHLAKVHQRTEAVVRTGADAPPRSSEFPRFSDDEALFDQFADTLDRLCVTLEIADPQGPSWNFTHLPQVNSFWLRRMVHETTLHRVDAELAAGRAPSRLTHDHAADGIDELVTVLMPNVFPHKEADLTATVHLHCTDLPGEWLITFADGVMSTTRDHGKGDLALRGPAVGIYLWAWGRQSVEDAGLEVLGDAALLDAWAPLVP
jgi:uncharacterized protein (TIGR03083 family)